MVNVTCKAIIADYIDFKKFTQLVMEDERRIYQKKQLGLNKMEAKLMITNVSVEDAGNYTCLAVNMNGWATARSSLTLRVG